MQSKIGCQEEAMNMDSLSLFTFPVISKNYMMIMFLTESIGEKWKNTFIVIKTIKESLMNTKKINNGKKRIVVSKL